jgi:hypothetical protein
MNTPSVHLGSKLGVYNTLFGAGWMAGPIAAGFASDAFGSGIPYLAFFILGALLQQQLQYLEKIAIIFRHKVLVCM